MIWLFSANKIKRSEPFSEQPTQLIVELNSSLRHIIVTKLGYLARLNSIRNVCTLFLIQVFILNRFNLLIVLYISAESNLLNGGNILTPTHISNIQKNETVGL